MSTSRFPVRVPLPTGGRSRREPALPPARRAARETIARGCRSSPGRARPELPGATEIRSSEPRRLSRARPAAEPGTCPGSPPARPRRRPAGSCGRRPATRARASHPPRAWRSGSAAGTRVRAASSRPRRPDRARCSRAPSGTRLAAPRSAESLGRLRARPRLGRRPHPRPLDTPGGSRPRSATPLGATRSAKPSAGAFAPPQADRG